MQEVLYLVFMVTGAAFMCIAGLGILRMPDLFMRLSAATKASTLGVGFLLLAVAVKYPVIEIISRSLAIIVFVVLTAPIAAHMIGRAAYLSGIPLWKNSIVDRLCDRYDRCNLLLLGGEESPPSPGTQDSE